MGLYGFKEPADAAQDAAEAHAAPAPQRARPAAPQQGLRAPLSSQPFAEAQHQARRRVETTQRQLLRQPTPHIPRLPNPTPQQAQSALAVARRSQDRAVGPGASTQRIRQYQRELQQDPRNREYIQTVEHYARALQRTLPAQTNFAQARPGVAPSGLGVPLLGTVVPGSVLQGIQGAIASKASEDLPRLAAVGNAVGLLLSGKANPALGSSLGAKLLNEATDLPAQSILSLYDVGKGLYQASAPGGYNEKPLNEILGTLGHMAKHPIASFEEHPIATGLTAAGIEGGVGGVLGAVARKGLLGDAVASAASTARPDVNLYGGEKIVNRRYNPDPLRKGAQVVGEKARPYLPGRFKQADPLQATGARLKRTVVGGIAKPGRVDFAQAAGDQMKANMVGGALKEAMHHTVKPKAGGAAQVPIFEGVVTSPYTAPAQLAQRLKDLQDAQQGLHPLTGPKVPLAEPRPLVGEDLAHNLRAQEAIKAAIAQPPTSRTFAHTRQIVEAQKPTTAGRVASGGLDAGQLRASLFPYAQQHMGARYYTLADHVAAERAAATPAERAAVSGRGDPQAVLDHERVIKEHAEARSAVPKAQEALRRAEGAHNRLKGRMSAPGTSKGTQDTAAGGTGDALTASEAKVTGAREGLNAANAKHMTARDAAKASVLPERKPGMRTANGEYLPTEKIIEHMKANGVPSVGFLSHVAPRTRSGVFGTGRSRPALESHQRTGASFINGTYDHSFGALLRQTQSENANLAAHMFENRKASRFDIGRGFQTKEAAQAYADNFRHTPEGQRIENGLGPLVPQPIAPKDVLAKDLIKPHDAHAVLKQLDLQEHTPATEGQGQWTLRPQRINDRFSQHGNVRSRSTTGRGFEAWTQNWRRAKLYTSTRHVAGVAQELGIRLAFEGIAPKMLGGRAGRTGAKFRKNLEALADDKGPLGSRYREVAGILGSRGSLYTSSAARDIINKGDSWQRTSMTDYIRHGREAATESRAARVALAPWRAYYQTLQKGMHKVEGQTYDAMLGKGVSEFFGGYRTVLKMQDGAMRQMIAGKLDSNTADALAHRVDDMMGNWSHLTPDVRHAVQKFTPFGLWWLNSMRWMYRLPVTHPVKTAIASALYNATRAERNRQGQGYDAAHPVPGFLTGTFDAELPIVGKVKLGPTYYSPGGTTIEPLKTAADMVLPQVSSIYAAAKDQSALTGSHLAQKGNKPLTLQQSLLNVLGETLSGPVPGATQAQQLLQMGGKPYGTANIITDIASKLGGAPQVKPGTERGLPEVLAKILYPTRFTFPGKVKGAGAGGGAARLPADPIERQMAQEAINRARGHGGLGADPVEAQMRREAVEEAKQRRGSASLEGTSAKRRAELAVPRQLALPTNNPQLAARLRDQSFGPSPVPRDTGLLGSPYYYKPQGGGEGHRQTLPYSPTGRRIAVFGGGVYRGTLPLGAPGTRRKQRV